MNDVIEIFTSASHQDVLALVTQIAVLLFTARLFGECAQRLGQPVVLGEILAGIFWGPSFLGKFFPFLVGIIIPGNPTQGHLIEAISLLGAIFLLLLTGLETDINLIRRHAKTALGVSLGGIFVTFISGFVLGQYLPDFLLVNQEGRLVFSLFMATAFSISSIPVIAKVLMDLKLMRRDIGQTIIAAGMSDDTIGWIILSVVAGLASGKVVTLGGAFSNALTVVFFLIVSCTLGKWIVKKSLDFVQDHTTGKDRLLTLVVVLSFFWGAFCKALHLEPVFGALVMGILFNQMPRLPNYVHQKLESIALGIFAPIFFSVTGLKVNILTLLNLPLLWLTLVTISVAVSSKMIGTFLGARWLGGKDFWSSLSYGSGLTARGAMGIIIATIGLSLGVLTQEMFSILILMAVVTSLVAPFLLRWTIKHVKPNEEESRRLKEEQLAQGSSIGRIHRVLVPVRRWESKIHLSVMQTIKSRLLQRIAKKAKLSITLLNVDKLGHKTKNIEFLNELGSLFTHQEVIKRIVESTDVINVVLDESQKNYDLLVLGASETQNDSEYIFSKVIDSILSLSTCMTIVVHAKEVKEGWEPKRILVPTNGSFAAKRAAEFSFLLIASEQERVYVLNVIERDQNQWQQDLSSDLFKRQFKVSESIVEELKVLGTAHGVKTLADVKIGPAPEKVILDYAKEENIDLIILGTDVRPASERLFLGPRVERIIKNSPCPVIILNSG